MRPWALRPPVFGLGASSDFSGFDLVISEKSYALMETGVYTFKVHPSASKPEIRDAVESIWGVEVSKVNTLNRKGKRRRTRGTNRTGTKPDTKRAMVTLAAGEIPLFEN